MLITIRTDDVGWTPKCEDKLDRGLQLAQQFHATMQGVPYLAAVIPAAVDKEGLDWLGSQPKGMTVALHGLNHAPVEFRGLTQEQMNARVAEARALLGGVLIEDMVLPFNQYEHDLAAACRLVGINFIWGGGYHGHTDPAAGPTPPEPYPIGDSCFVPSWKPTYAATLWRMSDECPALCNTLPAILDLPGKAVLTLHITWEAGLCDDFHGVKWLIETLGDRIISPWEYLK